MHQRPLGNQAPGAIHSTNAFAALDTSKTKKKKKAGKDDKSKKDKGKSVVSSTIAPLGSTTLPVISDVNFDDVNWAEEEEDDGFAMAPMADWVQEHQQLKAQAQAEAAEAAQAAALEEQEAEDHHPGIVEIAAQLGMEVGQEEDDTDEESESMSKPTSRNVSEIVSASASQRPVEPKVEEKQLSKKELKQKEMAELAAVLGELGINTDNVADGEPSESAMKRKKKKERAKQGTQVKEVAVEDESGAKAEQPVESDGKDVKVIDPAEARKKLAASKAGGKKKKPANPAIARAAAEEAKARAQKEAVLKDKDKKKHYNQERR